MELPIGARLRSVGAAFLEEAKGQDREGLLSEADAVAPVR